MLFIDVREAHKSAPTGKGVWLRGFLQALRARNVRFIECSAERAGIGWHMRMALQLRKDQRLPYYFSPTSFLVPWLCRSSVRYALLVHDLIAFRGEPHDRKAMILERLLLPGALRHATHVFATSNATAEDLHRHFPWYEREIVILGAGPLDPSPPLSAPDGTTILCAATLCPRKNQLRLIYAYAQLPSDLRASTRLILIGGRGWHDREILQAARETPGVEWKGYLSDDAYRDLLHRATVFAYPSLYEGFGLPVLDAMQRGIPVLTSDRGSLKEVAGDGSYLVDPESVSSIAKGLERVCTDSALRTTLRVRGLERTRSHSWPAVVDRFLAITEPYI